MDRCLWLIVCSVFTMSELLTALEAAGKIDRDMVKSVSDFIEQNQLVTSTVANNLNSVSNAFFSRIGNLYIC